MTSGIPADLESRRDLGFEWSAWLDRLPRLRDELVAEWGWTLPAHRPPASRTLHPDRFGCDGDHVDPYHQGGPPDQTCTCRLAPLCRSHHRLETHGGWTLRVLRPGSYQWTSPHGYTWRRDDTGTRPLDGPADPPPRHRPLP